jgi:hypothetical protein
VYGVAIMQCWGAMNTSLKLEVLASRATSRKAALLDVFIRMSYFDHKSNIETKMKRMKGTQVSRQRYRAAL